MARTIRTNRDDSGAFGGKVAETDFDNEIVTLAGNDHLFASHSNVILQGDLDNNSHFVNSTSEPVSEQLDDQFLAVLQIIAETLDDGSDIAS